MGEVPNDFRNAYELLSEAKEYEGWVADRKLAGYPRKPGDEVLRIYTTRADTLFGATYMVIAPEHRRKGIATQLFQAGKDWARKTGLRRLTVETQTKNYPALCLLERLDFSFCGYNDQYYANQDIALFFSLDLR